MEARVSNRAGCHVYPAYISQSLDHLPHVKGGALTAAVQIPAEHLQVRVRYQTRLICVLHAPEPQKIQDAQGLKFGASDASDALYDRSEGFR